MLTRAIAAFASHPRIDDILVVDSSRRRSALPGGKSCPLPRACAIRSQVARGGKTSFARVSRRSRTGPPPPFCIHDAARPFVPAALIDRVIEALSVHQGASPLFP